MLKLSIIFTDNIDNLLPDAEGTYESNGELKKITILDNENKKDTLLHELTHFILDLTNKGGFSHTKRFKKILSFLKENTWQK